MQLLRRAVQIVIILLIIIVPFLHFYGVMKYAKDSFSYSLAARQMSSAGWLQRNGIELIEKLLSRFEDQEKIISAITGSLWTFNIFGYRISDPLAAVSLSIAGGNFYWPFLTSILFLTLLSVILGRVFCGWLCPYHFIAEMNDKVRRLFIRLGILRPRHISFKKWTKYAILAVLLILSILAGISIIPRIYPPAVLSMEIFHYIFYGTVGFGTFFILFVLLTELMLFDRWWCRHVCPGGALYSLLGSVRIVRMVRAPDKCTLCVDCDIACPFDLFPMSDKMGMECDNCGLCRSACLEDALHYKIMPFWTERKMIREREEMNTKANKKNRKENLKRTEANG